MTGDDCEGRFGADGSGLVERRVVHLYEAIGDSDPDSAIIETQRGIWGWLKKTLGSLSGDGVKWVRGWRREKEGNADLAAAKTEEILSESSAKREREARANADVALGLTERAGQMRRDAEMHELELQDKRLELVEKATRAAERLRDAGVEDLDVRRFVEGATGVRLLTGEKEFLGKETVEVWTPMPAEVDLDVVPSAAIGDFSAKFHSIKAPAFGGILGADLSPGSDEVDEASEWGAGIQPDLDDTERQGDPGASE